MPLVENQYQRVSTNDYYCTSGNTIYYSVNTNNTSSTLITDAEYVRIRQYAYQAYEQVRAQTEPQYIRYSEVETVNAAAQAARYWVAAANPAAPEFTQEALDRALRLLDSLLTEEQRKERVERSQFHVVGSKGKKYRVRTTHASGNVEEIDEQGEVVARFCAHPRGVPLGDQLAAQKLALETDEESFLKIANCHFRRGDPAYHQPPDPALLEQIRIAARTATQIHRLDPEPVYNQQEPLAAVA